MSLAEETPAPSPQTSAIWVLPTGYGDPAGRGALRLDIGERPIKDIGKAFDGAGDLVPGGTPSHPTKIAIYVPRGIPREEEDAFVASIEASLRSKVPNLEIERNYIDVADLTLTAEAQAKRLEELKQKYPYSAPVRIWIEKMRTSLKEQVKAAQLWKQGWRGVKEWIKTPAASVTMGVAIGAGLAGSTAAAWITKSGLNPLAVLQWTLGPLFDFASVVWAKPIAEGLAGHALPRWIPASENFRKLYKERLSEPKSFVYNLLLYFLIRGGFDQALLHAQNPAEPSVFSPKFLGDIVNYGLGDLFFFSLAVSGYRDLRHMGYLSEPAQNGLYWGAGVLYKLAMLSLALHWNVPFWLAVGASWTPQALSYLLARILEPKNDRIVVIDPRLAGNRAQIDGLEGIDTAIPVRELTEEALKRVFEERKLGEPRKLGERPAPKKPRLASGCRKIGDLEELPAR